MLYYSCVHWTIENVDKLLYEGWKVIQGMNLDVATSFQNFCNGHNTECNSKNHGVWIPIISQ